tara:strand:- start:853 stop:2574 length:1722 start_codon:yes stop_codon:yes gene_type:complete
MAKAKKTTKKTTNKKIIKKTEPRGNIFYIMSPNCGWCKKADPIVKELSEQGYTFTTIDVTKPDEGSRANEIKQKYNVQCGTPLFVDEKTGENVCGFREKDALSTWLDGNELPAPPTPKSPMPRPPFMDAPEEVVNNWKKDYAKWSKENKHLPGLKTADDLLAMPRPKSQPPQPPNPNMSDNELEMWSLEWDEWAMNNNHLPGIQMSDALIARFKPQWQQQANLLKSEVESKNVELPESGFYYFFSPQCAFCTETSKQVNNLIKDGKKITKKDISIAEDKDFQSAILHKYNIQCGTPMLVDLSNGNYLCGAQSDSAVENLINGNSISLFPPMPPGMNATDGQISTWVDEYNEFVKSNSRDDLPEADEYMKTILNRRRVVEDHKKILNAGTPAGMGDNPNVTTRHISGQDAVGMTTHADSPKFNTRWYYHVLEVNKKTIVKADPKFLEEMKYQYLHREADGTYTKVIGDQWLQNELVQKHKSFKEDKVAIENQRVQKHQALADKTQKEMQDIIKTSTNKKEKIISASEKAKDMNKKNKVLTDTKGSPTKTFNDDIKKAISDMKEKETTTKDIPGF